jgi:multidrug resistance protein, MATE family
MAGDHTALSLRTFGGFATSMLLIGLISVGFGTVNLAMVASSGTSVIAGIGLGDLLVSCLLAAFVGLVDAFSAGVARAEGSGVGDEKLAAQVGGFLVLLVPVEVIGLLVGMMAGPVLELVGQDPTVAHLAASYLLVRMFGVALNVAFLASLEILKVCGLRNYSVAALVVGLTANAGLGWLFIHTSVADIFPNPAVGVATATLVAQLIMLVFSVVSAIVGFRRAGRRVARARLPEVYADAAEIGRVGTGIGVRHLNDWGGGTVAFVMLGSLGVSTLAALTVAMRIWTIFCRVPQACFTTVFVFTGYAIGSSRSTRDDVRRLMIYSAVPVAAASVLTLAAAPILIGFFGESVSTRDCMLLLVAYFVAIVPYFFGGFLGEVLAAFKDGAYLARWSTILTWLLDIPLIAVVLWWTDSAFWALISGFLGSAIGALVFARRVEQLIPGPESTAKGEVITSGA